MTNMLIKDAYARQTCLKTTKMVAILEWGLVVWLNKLMTWFSNFQPTKFYHSLLVANEHTRKVIDEKLRQFE